MTLSKEVQASAIAFGLIHLKYLMGYEKKMLKSFSTLKVAKHIHRGIPITVPLIYKERDEE